MGVRGKKGESGPVIQKNQTEEFDPAVSVCFFSFQLCLCSSIKVLFQFELEMNKFEVKAINKLVGKCMNWEMTLYKEIMELVW